MQAILACCGATLNLRVSEPVNTGTCRILCVGKSGQEQHCIDIHARNACPTQRSDGPCSQSDSNEEQAAARVSGTSLARVAPPASAADALRLKNSNHPLRESTTTPRPGQRQRSPIRWEILWRKQAPALCPSFDPPPRQRCQVGRGPPPPCLPLALRVTRFLEPLNLNLVRARQKGRTRCWMFRVFLQMQAQTQHWTLW